MSPKISSVTTGRRWQDWSKVRPFLSAEDIAAMEHTGGIRVEGDTAVPLENWYFDETAAEARLTLL